MLTVTASIIALLWTTPPVVSHPSMTVLSASEANVFLIPDSAANTAEMRVVIYSGSADDPTGKEGVAWLAARTMRREAAQHSAALAANLRLAVGKDQMVFSVASTGETLVGTLDAIETMLLKPSFDSAAISAEVEEQKTAIDSALKDPAKVAAEAFDGFVYRGHPYGHPVMGRLSSIAALSRDDLVAFYAAHWRKGNVAVGLSGNVAEPIAARLKADLAALTDGQPVRPARPLRWLARPRVVVVQTGAGVALKIGHALNVARAHPDYLALKVAQAELEDAGEGIEHVDATIEDYDPPDTARGEPGLGRRQQSFTMTASPGADSVSVVRRCLSRMTNLVAGVPEAGSWLEPARQRAESRGSYPAGGSSLEMAGVLDEFLSRTPGFSGRFVAGLQAVNADILKSALARVLFPAHVAIIAVVPDAKAFIDGMLAPPDGGLTRDDFEQVAPESLFR